MYTTTRPEDIQEAQDLARTSPTKCGQLYDAACENDFEKVKEILCWDDKSAEKVEFRKWYVNEKSWNDWRPLHAAAEAGLTEMAEFMIQCGADVNSLTNVKFTALSLGKSLSILYEFQNIANPTYLQLDVLRRNMRYILRIIYYKVLLCYLFFCQTMF